MPMEFFPCPMEHVLYLEMIFFLSVEVEVFYVPCRTVFCALIHPTQELNLVVGLSYLIANTSSASAYQDTLAH